ncbi:MAG: hypothetical protein WCF03_19790 [Nitrososphaeraceae archaeon]
MIDDGGSGGNGVTAGVGVGYPANHSVKGEFKFALLPSATPPLCYK